MMPSMVSAERSNPRSAMSAAPSSIDKVGQTKRAGDGSAAMAMAGVKLALLIDAGLIDAGLIDAGLIDTGQPGL